jgi:hypothetical protein
MIASTASTKRTTRRAVFRRAMSCRVKKSVATDQNDTFGAC